MGIVSIIIYDVKIIALSGIIPEPDVIYTEFVVWAVLKEHEQGKFGSKGKFRS